MGPHVKLNERASSEDTYLACSDKYSYGDQCLTNSQLQGQRLFIFNTYPFQKPGTTTTTSYFAHWHCL
jgi:hypothetical protein